MHEACVKPEGSSKFKDASHWGHICLFPIHCLWSRCEADIMHAYGVLVTPSWCMHEACVKPKGSSPLTPASHGRHVADFPCNACEAGVKFVWLMHMKSLCPPHETCVRLEGHSVHTDALRKSSCCTNVCTLETRIETTCYIYVRFTRHSRLPDKYIR